MTCRPTRSASLIRKSKATSRPISPKAAGSWQGVDVLHPDYTSRARPIFSVLQLTRWQEAVTLDGLKYVYDLNDVQDRLYDLIADPGETRDLIHTRPDDAARLKAVLGAWHTRQLTHYRADRRPFTHYVGQFVFPAGTGTTSGTTR